MAKQTDAKSLADKLTAFRGGLKKGEQETLDSLLRSFALQAERVPPAQIGQILKPQGATDAGVREVQTLIRTRPSGGTGPVAITPTITTITITTTLASHPIITCAALQARTSSDS